MSFCVFFCMIRQMLPLMDSPQNAAEHLKDTISRSRTQGIFRETFVYSGQSNFFRAIGPAPPVRDIHRFFFRVMCPPPKCSKKVVCPRGSEQTTAQRRNGLWNEKAYFASRTETVTSLASVLKSNAPPSCSAKRISYTFWARSLPEAFSSDQFPVKAWYRPSAPNA